MSILRKDTVSRLAKALRLAVSSRHYFRYAVRLAVGCLTRRGRAAFRRNLHSLTLQPHGSVDYPMWIKDRVRRRAAEYPLPATTGMFSFLTTVYETKGRYVLDLYESVKAQTCGDFEWVLLDNGSTEPDTLAAIETVRQDPRVRFQRVEKNLGILGGIASCLRRATGRYVVPLDSDDLLTPDALQIFAHVITSRAGTAQGEPDLLFTDEDKIREGPTPFEAYHKPAWDPVLFWNSCFIAHLCAIRRDCALQLGVYSDDGAKGCHDWDTFFRFLSAGYAPTHVPEVVYSWRVHPMSCAGNIFSKGYIYDSHRHVLSRNLALDPKAGQFDLRQSPLFPDTPDWWVARRRNSAPPISAVFVQRTAAAVPIWLSQHPMIQGVAIARPNDLSDLAGVLAALKHHDPEGRGMVLVCGEGVELRDDDGLWDAIGLAERFPDIAILGGRLLTPDNVIWSAGEAFAFHGLVGTPDRGRQALDPGYFAWLRKQRSVSSVHALLCLVRTDFLRDFAALAHPASIALLGAWLGAYAQTQGRRVAFTPMLTAHIPWDSPSSENAAVSEQAELLRSYPNVLDGERYYSKHFGLDPKNAYSPVFPEERQARLECLRNILLETKSGSV